MWVTAHPKPQQSLKTGFPDPNGTPALPRGSPSPVAELLNASPPEASELPSHCLWPLRPACPCCPGMEDTATSSLPPSPPLQTVPWSACVPPPEASAEQDRPLPVLGDTPVNVA